MVNLVALLLDSSTPSEPLDPPMIGAIFHNGVGTFYGDEAPKESKFGRASSGPTSLRHRATGEQAGSSDEGKTWETNWVQDITRVRYSRGPTILALTTYAACNVLRVSKAVLVFAIALFYTISGPKQHHGLRLQL